MHWPNYASHHTTYKDMIYLSVLGDTDSSDLKLLFQSSPLFVHHLFYYVIHIVPVLLTSILLGSWPECKRYIVAILVRLFVRYFLLTKTNEF